MLTIAGARRVLESHVLFTDLDLTVGPGRCAALTGPNGAGKSTLLRCVLDDERLDAGTITVAGMPPDDRDPRFRSLIAADTGEDATFFDLTVREHLRLVGTDADTVDLALADASLTALADRYPHTLSTGQRQRFALTAVFLRGARLLVLDEPERGLDSAGQRWLADRILREKADRTTLLIATHSRPLTERCADVVVELGR